MSGGPPTELPANSFVAVHCSAISADQSQLLRLRVVLRAALVAGMALIAQEPRRLSGQRRRGGGDRQESSHQERQEFPPHFVLLLRSLELLTDRSVLLQPRRYA